LKRKNEVPANTLFDERIDKKKKFDPMVEFLGKKPQRPKPAEELPITRAIKNCVSKMF
jgi:hypothetical protein